MIKFLSGTLTLLMITTTGYTQGWVPLPGSNTLMVTNQPLTPCGIQSITTDRLGNIYAGGRFHNSSGRSYIARWTNGVWTDISSAAEFGLLVNAPAEYLCADTQNNVYVATAVHYTTNHYVVPKWNGSTWSELGAPDTSASGPMRALAIDKWGSIYKGGYDMDPLTGHPRVNKWNGSSWVKLAGLNAAADPMYYSGWVLTLCTDTSGAVFAAGTFRNNSGNYYVAKWNGTSWEEVGGLNALHANGAIESLCADRKGNVYAAGTFRNGSGKAYVAKWDGTTWSELGGPNALNTYSIESLCTDSEGHLFAAGVFFNTNSSHSVARWSGTIWAELGEGTASLNANRIVKVITCDTAGNVYAAGDFLNSSNKPYVAKYTVVQSIKVRTQNNVPAVITTPAGTLQMQADILPAAADPTVVWSLINGTGSATISQTGLVTGSGNGTVWAKATAKEETDKADSMQIMISNQPGTGITDPTKTGAVWIFPNPAKDQLYIGMNRQQPTFRVHITDMRGILVAAYEFKAAGLVQPVNLSRLNPGLYFIDISAKDWAYRAKLILE